MLEDGYDLTWPESRADHLVFPSGFAQLLGILCERVVIFGEAKGANRNSHGLVIPSNAHQIVKQLLRHRLRQYPSTIAEDRDILAHEGLTRKRMAVEVRLGEKEILADWIKAIDSLSHYEASLEDHESHESTQPKKLARVS